jgi:hypothetical protein
MPVEGQGNSELVSTGAGAIGALLLGPVRGTPLDLSPFIFLTLSSPLSPSSPPFLYITSGTVVFQSIWQSHVMQVPAEDEIWSMSRVTEASD